MENILPASDGAACRRLRRVLSLLYMPVAFAYLETLISLNCGFDREIYNMAGALLTGIAFGFICNIPAFAFKSRRTGFTVAAVLTELICLYLCVQFFMYDSYTSFMDPLTMLQGAGGVMENFAEEVTDLIVSGKSYILAYELPFIVLLVFHRIWDFSRTDGLQLIALAVAAVFMQSAAAQSLQMTEQSAAKYSYEYAFNDGILGFGVLASTELNGLYSLTGFPKAPVTKLPDRAAKGGGSHGAPAFHGLNKLDLDFDSLMAAAPNKTIKDIHEYVASQQATAKNEYTGLFEGKNLIVICAETFSREAVDESHTPVLWHMATEGILIEDFYQPFWGGSTTSGEFAVLTGLVPVNHANSMQQTIGAHNYECVGFYLQDMGYTSLSYHNGDYDYYNRYKTHPCLGFTDFISNGTGMEDGLTDTWPPSDTEMIEFTYKDWIEDEKFYAYYMTYSGHSIYNFTKHEMAIKHKDKVQDLDNSTKIKAYRASQLELEEMVALLVQHLEEAGRLEDTLIVIAPDHYPYALQNSMVWANDRDYVRELYGYEASNEMLRDHNQLIIWSPCLEEMEEQIVVSEPVCSTDIVPTILNLMGASFDSRIYPGRDILSSEEGLVLWNSYSWKTSKGFYNANTGKFTAADGETVSQDYINETKEIVRNKIKYCKNVLDNDYFQYLFPNRSN